MIKTVLKLKLTATLIAATLLLSTSAFAEGSFEKDIEYRQGVMNALSWNMKRPD